MREKLYLAVMNALDRIDEPLVDRPAASVPVAVVWGNDPDLLDALIKTLEDLKAWDARPRPGLCPTPAEVAFAREGKIAEAIKSYRKRNLNAGLKETHDLFKLIK